MQNKNSLLHGRVGPALLRFALPFLAASLLQQLYSTVDMMAVGRLSATPAVSLSAVSTGGQMTYAVTSLLIGLATGSTVLIGQYVGAGRREDVSRTIGTMFPLFTLIALGVSVVMAALTGPLVALLQVPAQAVREAEQYLFICAVGMIFVTGYNMVSGILRGLGDSKSPMVLVAIACAINIIGDIVLVGPLQLGAAGAAIATVTAQGLSFLFSLVILRRRRDFPFDFKRSSFHLHRDQSKQLLKLGVPIAFQEFSIGISFLFITAFINRIGLDESACVGVVSRVSCIAMLVSTAFMSAIAAMSAQNIGAGQPKRARAAMLWGIAFSFIFSSVLFVLIQLFPGQILSFFTEEAGVIEKGILYLRSNIIDALLVSFVFCMNGFFSGCGHTTFSMVNNLISTYGVRVLGTLAVSMIPGTTMFHIGLAAPTASAVQIVIQLFYLRSGRWKRNTVLPDSEKGDG
ncbi:MAG: MATE family efflux transporter [Oscillospiraceae bacterium]